MKRVPVFIKKLFNAELFSNTAGEIVALLLVVSDSIIAGFFFGENAVAAVGSISPVLSCTLFIAMLVSEGCEILYPYEIGRMNTKKANGYFNTSFWAALFFGILLFTAILFGRNLFFDSIAIKGQVRFYAEEYLYFYKFTYFLYPLNELLAIMVIKDGDDTTCNICNGFMFFANIGLSIILAKFMGVRGIGLGTFIGTFGAIVILSSHFFKKTCTFKIQWHFDFKEFFTVAKFSVVDATCYVCYGILSYLLSCLIVRKYGQEYLSVYTVVYSLEELTLFFDGVGSSISGLMGTYRGEKNYPGVKETINYAAQIAALEGIIVSVLCFIFAPVIPNFFSLETEEYFTAAVWAVRVISFAMTFKSINFLISSYYIAIEKIGISVALTLIYYLFSPITTIFLSEYFIGSKGLWIGFALDPFAGFIVSVIVLRLILDKKFPYSLNVNNPDIYNFSFTLSEQNIVNLRDNVKKILTERQLDFKKINTIMLMIEDCYMLVREQNPGKKIISEFSLFLGDEIKIIFRDNGKIFDMTDSNNQVTSLRSFVVSSLMEHQSDKAYQITTEYNRNIFKFIK